MSGQRTLQRNAADPAQVKLAGRKQKETAVLNRAALVAVMSTPEGRRFLWNLLELTGPDRTVYDHSGSTMYFNEGRRNVGLEVKALMLEADEQLYQQMEREMRAFARRQQNEADAVQLDSERNREP